MMRGDWFAPWQILDVLPFKPTQYYIFYCAWPPCAKCWIQVACTWYWRRYCSIDVNWLNGKFWCDCSSFCWIHYNGGWCWWGIHCKTKFLKRWQHITLILFIFRKGGRISIKKCLVSTPVKAAYKSPGKVIIFILTYLHCIQKTKLRFFRSPLFETCVLAAGDFPQAGTLGSNETICCGIFWLGGKLSRYCRCWMYLMANLFWGRKTYTTSKLHCKYIPCTQYCFSL